MHVLHRARVLYAAQFTSDNTLIETNTRKYNMHTKQKITNWIYVEESFYYNELPK